MLTIQKFLLSNPFRSLITPCNELDQFPSTKAILIFPIFEKSSKFQTSFYRFVRTLSVKINMHFQRVDERPVQTKRERKRKSFLSSGNIDMTENLG